MEISVSDIGKVYSTRTKLKDDKWDQESSYIELNNEYSEESLYGLDDFSHVEIIFYMDQVQKDKIIKSARHPRNIKDWPKVGIFAQRAKNRPNQLGLTICKIIKIEGKKLFLEGLDAVDGTCILDIKPWVQEFAPRGKCKQPAWISELMNQYWS